MKNKIPFFRRRVKEAIPLSDPRIMQIFFSNQSQLIKPFAQHPAVYAPVQTKARNIGQVPFRLYKKGSEDPDERTPLNMLFMGNRTYPGSLFFEGICVQLDLYGQAFLLLDDARNPSELQLALTSAITPIISSGALVGWKYNGIVYPLERVIQIKYFNPYDTINGLAPLTCLMLGVDTDYNAMLYNKRYFENDGTPGMVYTTDQKLNDSVFTRLKEQLVGKHTGVNNAHKGMILDNGLKPADVRKANKDLEFLESRKFTIAETAMVFGVPKEALQMYEDINYATATTANRSFWEKTLMPMADMICDAINFLFLDAIGYYCAFDFSDISALSQPIAEKAGAVMQYYNCGVPVAQLNARFNLGFTEYEGWDLPYNGKQDITLTEPIKTVKELKPGNVPTEKQLEAIRKAQWIKLNDKVNPLIGKAAKQLRGYFRSINQKLLKRIMGVKTVKELKKEDIESLVATLFDDEKLEGLLRDDTKAALITGATTISSLGDFDIQTMIAQRMERIKDINETTKNLILDKFNAVFEDAAKRGLTEVQRAQALIAAAEDIADFNMKRARTIARTEMHGAFSMGRSEAAVQGGATHKRWIADVYSGKTRDSHLELHGRKVPINEPYKSNLMFPLDPAAAPEETINCRCVEVYEGDSNE